MTKINYFKRAMTRLAKQELKIILSDLDDNTKQIKLAEIARETDKWIEAEIKSRLN